MSVPTIAAKAAKTAVSAKAGAGKAKPKPRPYSGGSRSNIPAPGEAAPETAPPAATTTVTAPPSAGPADGGGEQSDREPAGGTAPSRGLPAAPASVRDGAGVVLGFLVWVWVVLPYLDGGTARVKNVLKAKFINETS